MLFSALIERFQRHSARARPIAWLAVALLFTGCELQNQLPTRGFSFRTSDSFSPNLGQTSNFVRVYDETETPKAEGLWVLVSEPKVTVVNRDSSGGLTNTDFGLSKRYWANLADPLTEGSLRNHANSLDWSFGASFVTPSLRGIVLVVDRVLVVTSEGQVLCDDALSDVEVRVSNNQNYSDDGRLKPRAVDPEGYHQDSSGRCSLGP